LHQFFIVCLIDLDLSLETIAFPPVAHDAEVLPNVQKIGGDYHEWEDNSAKYHTHTPYDCYYHKVIRQEQ
jgi:hypothetical protein